MRVPRQPAYYRLTEPAGRLADEPGAGPAADPRGAAGGAGRRRWPRWVALLVATAVLFTAAFGWTARRSVPPAAPGPAGTERVVPTAPAESPPDVPNLEPGNGSWNANP
ncbi:hypothetical protein RM844_31090 [Streptomyces sp. DSM 44915]|uniref:Serine/threonine protein kinase n=1 Tax=Streptomyces chisholmiae TaxID=3075540 RepID=A0ABU2K0K4_9ACTN|nr:hypothetical protein [Streptomyces sp. DSM 44915]MDT0270725.1 hypothetical protein [Streptomyces sp. DSM 44915]